MPKTQFIIEGPCAECVVAEVSSEVAEYWHERGNEALQEYMDIDPDARNEPFDVPQDAQIYGNWLDLNSERHRHGPLVKPGSFLIAYDIDLGREIFRVSTTEIRISVEEVLCLDSSYDGDFNENDEVTSTFKAIATGTGVFKTEILDVDIHDVTVKNLTMDVFTFDDDTTVITCIEICDDLLNLAEDSSRADSMQCWID